MLFIQRLRKNPVAKRITASIVGAAAGFAYYYYIGCAAGSCPITGNPYISTLYGAAIGFLLFPTPKAEKTDPHSAQDETADGV